MGAGFGANQQAVQRVSGSTFCHQCSLQAAQEKHAKQFVLVFCLWVCECSLVFPAGLVTSAEVVAASNKDNALMNATLSFWRNNACLYAFCQNIHHGSHEVADGLGFCAAVGGVA